MKTPDNLRNYENNLFLMKLLRINYKQLSYEEFKVISLLHILSNGTNCARISDDNLTAAGLNNVGQGRSILHDLKIKNIAIKRTMETNEWIQEYVCKPCKLKHSSKECLKRRSNIFLVKDSSKWNFKHRVHYKETLIKELQSDNNIQVPIDIKNINKAIDYTIQNTKKTDEDRLKDMMEDFDDGVL